MNIKAQDRPVEDRMPLRVGAPHIDRLAIRFRRAALASRVIAHAEGACATFVVRLRPPAGQWRMDEPASGSPVSRDPEVDLLDRWQASDGTRLAIRPLRADDAAQELAFLESLSAQTRYERTFSHRGLLTPGELRKLIRFDVREEIALAAVIPGASGDTFVAVARLKRIPQSDRCEFAIVVGDRWQRRGVGLRLLGKLIEVSRRAGIAHIVGYTFSTNEAMKALARKAGFKARSDPDDPSLALLEIDLRSGAQQ